MLHNREGVLATGYRPGRVVCVYRDGGLTLHNREGPIARYTYYLPPTDDAA